MIPRVYNDLDKWLTPGKVVVIYGPRRVGKTTLAKNYLDNLKLPYLSDSGDNIETRRILASSDFSLILPYANQKNIIFLDEAQLIPGVGQGLKIIVDQLPDKKIIATGSSSFELAGQLGEPLTGRKWTLTLYPIAQMELAKTLSVFELEQNLKNYLIFGSYPEIITAPAKTGKIDILREITNSYLFKDILAFEGVRGSNLAYNLTKLLALQIGNEVSLNELANSLDVNIKTIQRYLDILEKAFIIYRLGSFSRNLRDEIRSKQKYYFFDNGVRNAIISQFNDLSDRSDIGALWENFLVAERLKRQEYTPIYANNYFWRTWDQQEIDWVEERDGKLFGFEFKWSTKKKSKNKEFTKTYKEASLTTITPDNYLEFIL